MSRDECKILAVDQTAGLSDEGVNVDGQML